MAQQVIKRNQQKRLTKRAPDAGDSAHIPSSFLRLSLFLAGRLRRPHPSAGNANRWADLEENIMNISNDLRNQIYNNMQLKSTDELLRIWKQNDHEEWSDVAFEAVKQILLQRTGTLPEAQVKTNSLEKPADWERINWKSISDMCDKKNSPMGLVISEILIVLLSIPFAFSIYFSSATKGEKSFSFLILFLVTVGIFGAIIRLYFKMKHAERIVARARVFLKDSRSRGKGEARVYDVGFAINSAFTISKNGELIPNEKWRGHHTFTVINRLYQRIDEQQTVNLVFLSSNQILGLLEDFKNK